VTAAFGHGKKPSIPTYALITPAHNEEAFIEKTIESVLSQTVLPIKWVVVDDGSTDGTVQIAKSRPDICLLRQHNQGLSCARNVGLAYSNGAYIVFLDADDLLLPDAIDIGIHALAARKDCPLTFGLAIQATQTRAR